MSQLTFLLYILSQSVSAVRPMLVLRLKEWHEKFTAEPNQFQPGLFCHEIGLSVKSTERFKELHASLSPAKLQHDLQASSTGALNLFEGDYPEMLNEIPDPPLVLFYRGNLELLNSGNPIAMVGSRRATKYGEMAVQKLINGLSGMPVSIISGLAYGIDAHTHKTALANDLPTVAVLGSGLDDQHIFPRENFQLAKDILQNDGLLLSEYPPGASAQKFQFIARNRIIAGLAKLVVIVEAALKSGALITADFATEYNRAVQAVPGSILSPTSAGPIKLMQSGAMPILDSSDILAELDLKPMENPVPQISKLADQEVRVLEYIQHETTEFEYLMECSGLSVNELQTSLANLELRRIIKQVGPQVYQKI